MSAGQHEGRISVIIPTFNAEATVDKAIRSVLEQDFAPHEILIVDDCSEDGTLERVRQFEDDRIEVIALEENVGPGAARNVGLERASGEFVAFLDADDTWREDKLSQQFALMRSNPRLTLVTCDSIYLTPEGEFKRRSHEVLPPGEGADGWKTLLAYNFMPTPTVMARREKLVEVGGFAHDLEFGEDLDLWIRTSLDGEIGVVREVLVEIIEWSGSLTGTIRHTQPDFVLPYIARYLDRLADRLTARESKYIRGRRFFESGTVLFYSGRTFTSLPYFLRSFMLGYRQFKSAMFLPKACFGLLTFGRYPGTQH